MLNFDFGYDFNVACQAVNNTFWIVHHWLSDFILLSGCYLWPSGIQYHGTWESGYRHGNGVEKHANYVYKVSLLA